MDMTKGGGDDGGREGTGWRGIKGRKNGATVIALSIKYFFKIRHN